MWRPLCEGERPIGQVPAYPWRSPPTARRPVHGSLVGDIVQSGIEGLVRPAEGTGETPQGGTRRGHAQTRNSCQCNASPRPNVDGRTNHGANRLRRSRGGGEHLFRSGLRHRRSRRQLHAMEPRAIANGADPRCGKPRETRGKKHEKLSFSLKKPLTPNMDASGGIGRRRKKRP